MTAPERPGWYVACPVYWRGPFKDRATAECELGRIEMVGACQEAHEVKEVAAK